MITPNSSIIFPTAGKTSTLYGKMPEMMILRLKTSLILLLSGVDISKPYSKKTTMPP
jgi:hypothetical protein